jgi:putative DNA primase/helicase
MSEVARKIVELLNHNDAPDLKAEVPVTEDDMRTCAFSKQRVVLGPLQPNPNSKRALDYKHTDLGNAEYFVELFGYAFRFDIIHKRWLEWRNHRWEPNGRAAEAAQIAARTRLLEAIAIPAGNTREEAVKWAMHSEKRYAIESVLALADDMTPIAVRTDAGWDSDLWLLGVPNGVVDLRDGTLRDGRQDDLITMHTGVPFDAAAKCPRWEQFLDEVFQGDADLVTYVRKAIGYTLTGEVKEDVWFGCYGGGRNGKSTFLKILQDIWGDYGYRASFSLVVRSSGSDGRRDFDTQYLHCKRFVMASETREGGTWDEERLKGLTGRDSIHAEIKHGAEFNFWPSHKLWFTFNHLPRTRDHSAAFWRRARLIPFNRKFEGTDCDLNLDAKLISERQGILAWAVRACAEWYQDGLNSPTAVQNASKQYEVDEDPLGEFIQQHVSFDGPGFYLGAAFSLYQQWGASEHIDKRQLLGRNRFGTLLEGRGFTRGRKNNKPFFERGTLRYMCVCMQTPCACMRVGSVAP